MDIQKKPFGNTSDDHPVDAYTLTSPTASATIITYGAALTRLIPDRSGTLSDIVLGFDNLHQYETQSPFFGATVGRFANRIAHANFQLDGKSYPLAANNGPNHLHGGLKGYDKRIWRAHPSTDPQNPSVRFALTDPDGTEGYPGTVQLSVTYTLTGTTLKIDYLATTNQPTPINLTNHTYFNLKDAGQSDILSHILQLNADTYTPVDATLIPTGEIARVQGTPFDFTSPKPIGRDMLAVANTPPGYDHNFVLRSQNRSLALAAIVTEPITARRMEVWTTTPGMQLYTGNFLDGTLKGKNGTAHHRHSGLSLECQDFPDAVNQPAFPSTILRPGQTYRQTTELRFMASPSRP